MRLTASTRFQSASDVSINGANTAIAGVVDQRVEPSEAPFDFGEGRRNRIRIGDVAVQGQRVVGPRQRLHAFLQKAALDVEQRHAPAVGEEAFGHGKPDAARGAGHQRDFLRGGGHVDGNPYVGVPKKVYSAETNLRNSVFTRSSTFA